MEQPSRYCQKHPHGGTPCGACADQRHLYEKWDDERREWNEWNRDLRADIKACRHCNDAGLYTDDEGLWWCEHDDRNAGEK